MRRIETRPVSFDFAQDEGDLPVRSITINLYLVLSGVRRTLATAPPRDGAMNRYLAGRCCRSRVLS